VGWGSLFFDTPSTGSVIDHAEITEANVGIYMFYPDDVTVECSLVHNFEDVGIYVYGASGDGATIEYNSIVAGVGAFVGIDGIRLERADQCSVTRNLIDGTNFSGLTTVRSGIRILNGQHFCLNLVPYESRTQTIAENRVKGPGLTSVAAATGIDVDWGCGGTNRAVTVSGNFIDKWPQSAVRFDQSFDLDIGCNGVDSSDVGVDYLRSGLVSSPAVRLRRNGLIAVEAAAAAVRSTESSTLDLGPNDTYTGQNSLWQASDAWFLLENDPDSLDLDARYNYWYRDSSLVTLQDSIEARIGTDLDSAQVDISSYYTSAPTICYPDASISAGCAGGGSRIGGGPLGGGLAEPVSRTPLAQFETSLGRPKPNPFDRSTRLEFTVGTNALGRYRIEVFNVAGRRVRTLLDGFPGEGHHEARWEGDSESGRTAAPGVYFVRMTGPSYNQKRKLVLLR
jgi:hypothetical protein